MNLQSYKPSKLLLAKLRRKEQFPVLASHNHCVFLYCYAVEDLIMF